MLYLCYESGHDSFLSRKGGLSFLEDFDFNHFGKAPLDLVSMSRLGDFFDSFTPQSSRPFGVGCGLPNGFESANRNPSN